MLPTWATRRFMPWIVAAASIFGGTSVLAQSAPATDDASADAWMMLPQPPQPPSVVVAPEAPLPPEAPEAPDAKGAPTPTEEAAIDYAPLIEGKKPLGLVGKNFTLFTVGNIVTDLSLSLKGLSNYGITHISYRHDGLGKDGLTQHNFVVQVGKGTINADNRTKVSRVADGAMNETLNLIRFVLAKPLQEQKLTFDGLLADQTANNFLFIDDKGEEIPAAPAPAPLPAPQPLPAPAAASPAPAPVAATAPARPTASAIQDCHDENGYQPRIYEGGKKWIGYGANQPNYTYPDGTTAQYEVKDGDGKVTALWKAVRNPKTEQIKFIKYLPDGITRANGNPGEFIVNEFGSATVLGVKYQGATVNYREKVLPNGDVQATVTSTSKKIDLRKAGEAIKRVVSIIRKKIGESGAQFSSCTQPDSDINVWNTRVIKPAAKVEAKEAAAPATSGNTSGATAPAAAASQAPAASTPRSVVIKVQPPTAAASRDPMETLREKLAEKLGATPASAPAAKAAASGAQRPCVIAGTDIPCYQTPAASKSLVAPQVQSSLSGLSTAELLARARANITGNRALGEACLAELDARRAARRAYATAPTCG